MGKPFRSADHHDMAEATGVRREAGRERHDVTPRGDPMPRIPLILLVCGALAAAPALWRWFARTSNTQVRRINQ